MAYNSRLKGDSYMKTASLKKRESNFELLRIISMLMIMFTHFMSYSGLQFNSTFSANHIFLLLMNMGGKLGADIFVLISGYFLINSKGVKTERVLKILGCSLFYSITTYIVGLMTGNQFTFVSFVKAFLPVTYEHWWFISSYFVLYLIHPLLNRLINNLDSKTFVRSILLMFVLWSVIPTFLFSSYQSNNLIFFVFLYFIAGYIRFNSEKFRLKSKKYMIVFGVSALISFLSVVIISAISMKWKAIGKTTLHFYSLSSVFMVICATAIFLAFKNITIKNNKYINLISSATLGVYLIHDSNYTRTAMWSLFNKLGFSGKSGLFIVQAVLFVFVVFVVCVAIDFLRINTVEKCFMKISSKIISELSARYKKLKISKYI